MMKQVEIVTINYKPLLRIHNTWYDWNSVKFIGRQSDGMFSIELDDECVVRLGEENEKALKAFLHQWSSNEGS